MTEVGSRYGRLMFVILSLNCRVLPDMGWLPGFSVGLLRGNYHFFLLVDFHADQGFVKSLNDFSGSEYYLQGLVVSGRVVESCGFRFFLHRSIENLPSRVSSKVMYRHGVSFLRLHLKVAQRRSQTFCYGL